MLRFSRSYAFKHKCGQQSCFWGLPALQTVMVWLIDLKHHVIMKFGQKSKSCHIFLVENEGPGECLHMHVLPMQWKIQSDLPFLHTHWKSGTPVMVIRKVAIYDQIHCIKRT